LRDNIKAGMFANGVGARKDLAIAEAEGPLGPEALTDLLRLSNKSVNRQKAATYGASEVLDKLYNVLDLFEILFRQPRYAKFGPYTIIYLYTICF
jgi:hypothetical protein